MHSSVARCVMIRKMLRTIHELEREEASTWNSMAVFDELEFLADIVVQLDQQERNRILLASCLKNPQFVEARIGLTIQQHLNR